jgi:hypothetical protein
MKKSLQDVTDFKVMNIKECLDSLGWTYTDDGENLNYITCPCGGELEFRGFFGTEVIECDKCGKHMVDLFSPIPVTSGSCSILNPKDYEMVENRHWIAIDGNGGIK